MRYTHNSDMQTNIYNAFCTLSIAWRCNNALVTVFFLGDADVNPTGWVHPLLDLQFLQTCRSQFQHNDYTKGYIKLSKFINHS